MLSVLLFVMTKISSTHAPVPLSRQSQWHSSDTTGHKKRILAAKLGPLDLVQQHPQQICIFSPKRFPFLGLTSLKGKTPAQIFSKEKGMLQVLMPTMTSDMNSWSPETCWHVPTLACGLCRFPACVNREVSLAVKLTSDLFAWIHWTIVIHNSGHICDPCATAVARGAHLRQGLIMIGKQVYISYALLFWKYLGCSLAFHV